MASDTTSAFRRAFDNMQPAQILGLARGLADVGLVAAMKNLDEERQSHLLHCLEKSDLLRLQKLCCVQDCDCKLTWLPCKCSQLRDFVRKCGAGASPGEARSYIGQPVSIRELQRAERQIQKYPDPSHRWVCDCPAVAARCPHVDFEAADPPCPLADDVERLLLELLDPKGYANRSKAQIPSAATTTAAASNDMAARHEQGQELWLEQDAIRAARGSTAGKVAIQGKRLQNGARGVSNGLRGA
jgi:hypothetical protein